ncbi:MAG: multicomponent Na+:H+ antiporter subunit D [Patiriisocius sp.]|jgi:multicomponent Na+:H+ antiporter subunit D
MWMTDLPPAFIYYIGALLVLIPQHRIRAAALLAIPILGGLAVYYLPDSTRIEFTVLGYDLMPVRVDKLSLIFAYVFNIAAFIAILYSFHVRDRMQQAAGVLYAGSALGVVFAGDLITLFVFWELLAFSSVFLIWAKRTQKSYQTGLRYLLLHALSGLILLGGAIGYYQSHGTFHFDYIGIDSIYGMLILLAIGIKCAFPFVHNWLTEAYPESTPTGTVFLSAFTTKAAVYLLARSYPGTELLVYIGAFMTCFPIFYAVIENDLRRVLAYSMINQIGFMVCGIGIGTALAVNGAVAHAFNDIIFKGLLFMAMGAVLTMTGRINGSDLGGLYKTMPKTTVLCIVGAASISAFPLFSGFVSKSMIMSAAIKEGYDFIWLALLFASAGVFHHAGIKIPYFAFFAHDQGLRAADPPRGMLLAMTLSATLCIAIGVYPAALYSALPFSIEYTPYDTTHVLAQTQILFYSALAFVWLNLMKLYPPELPSTNLDFEWIYRKFLPRVISTGTTQLALAMGHITNSGHGLGTRIVQHLRELSTMPAQLSTMVQWTVIMLPLLLILALSKLFGYA